jgi:long-chain fatty acid transport protein
MLALACSAQVHAGGIGLYGSSVDNAALSNAGMAARAQGPDTIAGNIAGLSFVEGTQVNAGASVLWGKLEPSLDEVEPAGRNGSNAIDPMPAPMGFVSHQLDDHWTVGFGAYGDFGDRINYDSNWGGRYFIQEATLIGVSMVPSVAYRFNEEWSVGVGLRAMYGITDLELAGNVNAPGQPDGKIKYEDEVWGFGGNLGLIYAPSEGTRFGLAYTSEIDLDFDDNLKVNNVPVQGQIGICPGRLCREINGNLNVEGKLKATVTVPQTVTASFLHQLDPKWTLLGSVNWQDWSEFSNINIDLGENASTEADIGWKDTYHVSLGAQYQWSQRLRYSLGMGYDSSAVDDDHRAWMMPVTDIFRVSLGGVYDLDAQTSVHAGYMLALLGDVEVSQEHQAAGGNTRVADGQFEQAYVHYLGAAMTMRF